ncbi:hypothetical protein [Rhodoferax ferrireducens]|uniref:hypothetical protein n=1 Tax=Rhodoferax ferrireducens TaxID=192843 RepID=UPI0018E5770B|nr:hypothetical protein [Rhodoferax ferrireducens]
MAAPFTLPVSLIKKYKENTMRVALILCVLAPSLLAACSSPPRVAQKKQVEVAGHKLEFGGEYVPKQTTLTLSVNGDPVLSGRFPPYTPTLNLRSEYQGMEVSADCYFGSVLGGKRGVLGIVAGAVQVGNGRSGDKCNVLVGGKVVEALYF